MILFAPNLVSSQAATETDGAQVEGQPAAIPGDASVATADPGTLSCDGEDEYMAGARALDKDERKRCRRAPVGAFFFIALPASLFILAPDGQEPTVKSPGLPSEPISTPDGGGEGDDGNDGSGTGGGGVTDGGSDGGGTSGGGGAGTGGNSGGGNTRGGNTGGGTVGGGSTGGGTTGGGSTGGGSHPGAGDLPPISQVPEPVSTTLFGIGLASLAGARMRRRRQGAASPEDS